MKLRDQSNLSTENRIMLELADYFSSIYTSWIQRPPPPPPHTHRLGPHLKSIITDLPLRYNNIFNLSDFCTLLQYIYKSQQTRGIHPMLFKCWASVEDGVQH